MIKILVVHIRDLYLSDRIDTECWCFRSEHESNNPIARVFSHWTMHEWIYNSCTAPFSNNELCRFHISQWVRVETVEPISADSKWASDNCISKPITKTLWTRFGSLCVKKLIFIEDTLQHYLLLLFNICLFVINFNNSGFTYIRCSKWKVYVGWVSQSSDVS